MEKLNYDVIKKVGYDGYLLKEAPEKVCKSSTKNGQQNKVLYIL